MRGGPNDRISVAEARCGSKAPPLAVVADAAVLWAFDASIAEFKLNGLCTVDLLVGMAGSGCRRLQVGVKVQQAWSYLIFM